MASCGDIGQFGGAGSSDAFNAIDAWRTAVTQLGMTVDYVPDGSATGRAHFRDGTVDWAESDIPYGIVDGSNVDPPPTRVAYVPDVAEGTALMYNLRIGTRRVTNLRLSGSVIAGIFTGVIMMWNDNAIAADNPGLKLPAIRIVPVVRADGSGTTAYFTQWLLATQPAIWQAYRQVVGHNPCTQTSVYPVLPGSGMVAQSGDLGVAGYVSQTQAVGSIGFAVSLLNARINLDQSNPATYLTEDLSQVYTDSDRAPIRCRAIRI